MWVGLTLSVNQVRSPGWGVPIVTLHGNEVLVLKCLVVDDEPAARALLEHYVSPLFDCSGAGDGREAVEAVRNALAEHDPFDLICLDIMMPVMDGLQALRAIRDMEEAHDVLEGDRVKVVMTTALRDAKCVLSAFRLGCQAYIVKPVKKQDLWAEIDRFGLLVSQQN